MVRSLGLRSDPDKVLTQWQRQLADRRFNQANDTHIYTNPFLNLAPFTYSPPAPDRICPYTSRSGGVVIFKYVLQATNQSSIRKSGNNRNTSSVKKKKKKKKVGNVMREE